MKEERSLELMAAVMATADAFLRESQRLFRPHGLTGAQYNVLNLLAARRSGISQRELSDLLVVDRSNVTGLLDRLEKAGWVRRGDHPEDRRIYQIAITPAGRRLWAKVHPVYVAVVTQVTAALSLRQMNECGKTLRVLEAAAVRGKLPD